MSRKSKALLLALAAIVQLAVVVAVGAGSANAAVGPADDRQKTTPTSWWSYTGVTAAQVNSRLSANSARLTDIHVDNASTPTFSVVMVKNSGSYASGWWWYYGKTAAQVGSLLTTNNARLISARAYSTSAGTRFAVVMVANTGANAKSWWWYYGVSATTIGTNLARNNARLINLTPYPGGGYLAIMVDNTGTNGTSWWWYYHVTPAYIASHLSTNHAHLIDLSHNGDGTFNAIMYAGTSTRWYWYYGQNLTTAVNRALQQGERIIDVTKYGSAYAVVETRNTNTLSEKLWNIIGPKVDSGAYGFYLKQVGGSTLASLLHTKQYEPASALKVLYHAKTIRSESLGNSHDADSITYHYNPADPTNKDICPDKYAATKTTNLKTADEKMMWNSDNRMTRGILEKYGKSSMLSYASALGLTRTEIHHNIGCPTSSTHNWTTLSDLGKVYAAYQNGTITTNSTWKTRFHDRMLNESNYEPNYHNAICPIVNQEATSLGKSATVATNFCNALTWVSKGGSYAYSGSFPYKVSWDGVSLTGVPYKTRSGSISRRFFVFGQYVDETTINNQTEKDSVTTAQGKLYKEALRAYIHAALATW